MRSEQCLLSNDTPLNTHVLGQFWDAALDRFKDCVELVEPGAKPVAEAPFGPLDDDKGATMRVYYSPFSSNVRKVRMAALLLGIDVALVPLDLASGEQRAPEYLALNPMGRVPVLEDGDFVLWESHAIMTYLADTKPGNTVYPREARPRADVDRWLYWAASHWSPTIAALNMENMLKKLLRMGEPDPEQIKRQENFFRQFGGILDGYLASRAHQWICGGTLTLADLAIAAPLMYAQPARLPLQEFAHLRAWLSRVQSLEAWKKTEPPPLRSSP